MEVTRKYTYTYDGLSRLTSAAYTGATTTEKYNTSYSYDKHGNILSLKRYGKRTASSYPLVDNLAMSYSGNQLTGVTESASAVSLAESNDLKASSTYTYNKNGAMWIPSLNRVVPSTNSGCDTERFKNISKIAYNSLNLPDKVRFLGSLNDVLILLYGTV